MKHCLIFAAALATTPVFADDAAFEITFRNHVADGLAEQDVYVRGGKASGVQRPGPGSSNLNAELYASANPQAHAPGDPDAIGPFPVGRALDVTLGEWLAATGSGEYHCENGEGHLTVVFEGLVPDGLYTIWHFFMANGATEPFIGTFDLPIGAFDGSQASFVAAADGT
ncbi:MAG: hypothetical protein AAGG72_06175, partial [Pseudomonadota bacterium]